MNTPALPGLISVFKRPLSAAQHGSQASATNSTIRIDLKFYSCLSRSSKATSILLGLLLGGVGALLALLLSGVLFVGISLSERNGGGAGEQCKAEHQAH